MAELKTRDLVGVEILDIGTWQASTGEFTVTDADLSELVANFALSSDQIKVPAKLGHDEGQRLLQQDGYPSAGWLRRLYRDGTKLVGDFGNVPAKVADIVEAGGYRKVSAEIWHNVTVGSQKFARLLMGVALLGEDAPAVTTLDDILELYGAKAQLAVGPTSKVQVVVLDKGSSDDHMAMTPAELRAHLAEHGVPKALLNDATQPEMRQYHLPFHATRSKKEAAMDPRKPISAQIRESWAKFRSLIKAAAVDVSQEQKRDELQEAVDARFGNSLDGSYPWIVETYDDSVIVQKGADYFRVPYLYGSDGTITFGDPVPVVQTWAPDPSVSTGGSDLPADTPSAEGSGVTTPATQASKTKEADMADLKRIATALGLADGADEATILAKIQEQTAATTKLSSLEGTVTELQTNQKKRDAADAVAAAIRAGKVAPAQREWALTYAETDPKGFTTYVEKTPALFTAERGTSKDAPETGTAIADVNTAVQAAMTADPKLTFAKALDKVTRENRDLAKRALAERQPVAAGR